MDVYFIEFCAAFLLITMGCVAITAVIRPRVFRIAFRPWWLGFILAFLFVVQVFVNHAVLAGLIAPITMSLVPLLLAFHFWIAIIRVWMRHEPTDRWLFHVPPVPESMLRKRPLSTRPVELNDTGLQ